MENSEYAHAISQLKHVEWKRCETEGKTEKDSYTYLPLL